jgi:hypothetical protein
MQIQVAIAQRTTKVRSLREPVLWMLAQVPTPPPAMPITPPANAPINPGFKFAPIADNVVPISGRGGARATLGRK